MNKVIVIQENDQLQFIHDSSIEVIHIDKTQMLVDLLEHFGYAIHPDTVQSIMESLIQNLKAGKSYQECMENAKKLKIIR